MIGADGKFKIDATLQKAIDTYKLMTKTTSSLLLEDIKVSIDKIRTYLRTAQIDDDTFSKYIDSVNKLIPLSEKVSIAEKKVSREIEDLVELRGAKSQTILDGGFGNFMK